MRLLITREGLELIRRHAARQYPGECCGAMLGSETDGVKRVREIFPLTNLRGDPERAGDLLPLESAGLESERNRFLIDPAELIKLEKDALTRHLDVIGFYHSHPDHPAKPSAYDLDHAFPWYSYVIIAVQVGRPGPFASFRLREDRSQFTEEIVEVTDETE